MRTGHSLYPAIVVHDDWLLVQLPGDERRDFCSETKTTMMNVNADDISPGLFPAKPMLSNVSFSQRGEQFIVDVDFQYSAWDSSEPQQRLFSRSRFAIEFEMSTRRLTTNNHPSAKYGSFQIVGLMLGDFLLHEPVERNLRFSDPFLDESQGWTSLRFLRARAGSDRK